MTTSRALSGLGLLCLEALDSFRSRHLLLTKQLWVTIHVPSNFQEFSTLAKHTLVSHIAGERLPKIARGLGFFLCSKGINTLTSGLQWCEPRCGRLTMHRLPEIGVIEKVSPRSGDAALLVITRVDDATYRKTVPVIPISLSPAILHSETVSTVGPYWEKAALHGTSLTVLFQYNGTHNSSRVCSDSGYGVSYTPPRSLNRDDHLWLARVAGSFQHLRGDVY
ncbi:hypothetical protein GLOTRDRAFT_97185 [Gloeophyllum trabeum ATCC 11539]|uniref:Uncharacterized protein n=1 Tax=Gloeophyllum trabeum (strain ATCC 11539 / FP-39264 / Madison 617) TaxID=670483 RepID=S7PS07_GLOTA|nr:uncharacterized protein GLOTRDRAFT_97185 [Gloeophyllum trabeum ATCC 11539]EPQ50173.1 hypothetical protein GLOTRDRAFT_97185 [Gloeophyllum trabeum ATCC 11539]